MKRGRHHAEDRIRESIERDRLAENRWIGLKLTPPKPIHQDNDALVPRLGLLLRKCAAKLGRNIEHREDAGRGAQHAYLLRRAARSQRHGFFFHHRHRLHGAAVLLPEGEVAGVHRQRRVNVAELRNLFFHHHQLPRLRIGKRPQQHVVHQRENGGRRSNTERQRQDGSQSETGRFEQLACRIAQVIK